MSSLKFKFILILNVLLTFFSSQIKCYISGRNVLYGISSYRHLKFNKPGNILKRVGISSHISSGFNTYLPYGQLLVDRLIQYVESKFTTHLGSAKVKFPNLMPQTLMSESRKSEFGKTLFNITDRYDRKYYLSPTSEEIASQIISQMGIVPVKPIYLFQTNEKYRDEMRPCFRSLRYREFLMLDLYSFHNTMDCLNNSFNNIAQLYRDLFNDFNIPIIEKDNNTELEFLTTIGDKEVELGHLFKLGTKFTEGINSSQPIYMGSYGLGLLRLLTAILWINKDGEGVNLPPHLNVIKTVIMDPKCEDAIDKLSDKPNSCDCILLDDREGRTEDKLSDLRAIGIPRVIISYNNGVVRYWDRNQPNITEVVY